MQKAVVSKDNASKYKIVGVQRANKEHPAAIYVRIILEKEGKKYYFDANVFTFDLRLLEGL